MRCERFLQFIQQSQRLLTCKSQCFKGGVAILLKITKLSLISLALSLFIARVYSCIVVASDIE